MVGRHDDADPLSHDDSLSAQNRFIKERVLAAQ
jgi:hypothetical protein